MTDDQDRPAISTFLAPQQNLESKPFWDAARDGRFLIKRCKDCGEPHWYPRTRCPFCFSPETVWEESPGAGVIYTYTIMRRGVPAPYAIGYVTLDEGVSLLTNFVECDFDALEIGQRVRLRWSPSADGTPVFSFTPAE